MKILKAILLLSTAVMMTSVVSAADNQGQDYGNAPVVHNQGHQCPCPQPCPCPDPCPCMNPQPYSCAEPCCDYNPCCQDDCCRFLAYVDWLWWKTRKCELDYAIPKNSSTNGSKRHVKDVSKDWNEGYRIGLFRDCNDSFFGLRVTHFDDCSQSSASDRNSNLAATRITHENKATSNSIQFAKARYKVNLDVVDLEAGWTNPLDCNGAYSVFGGLRYASIDQHLNSIYTQDLNDRKGLTSNADKVRQKVDMNAWGLYVGAGGYKDLCRGIGIFGRGSAGWLVGNFDRKFVQLSSETTDPFEIEVDLRDRCHRIVTNLNLALGLQYGFCGPCCNTWSIKLGYEFHSWLNTSDFFDLIQNSGGDLQIPNRRSDNIGFDGIFFRLQGQF